MAKLRNRAKRRGASLTLDLRVRQAAAFLERAAHRLPRNTTRAMWKRIAPRLVCKRAGWKGRSADFLRAFRHVHGCTLKQFQGELWKGHRARLASVRGKERGPNLPYSCQIGEGWFYRPGWIPADAEPGDWVTLREDGTARKVQPPARKTG